MSQIYLVDAREVLNGIEQGIKVYLGPTAGYCNFIGIVETLLDDYFYGCLYNKQTPVEMVVSYHVPSEPAEAIIGQAKYMLTKQLNALLTHVPKDRWVNYCVTPYGEIEITDYQIDPDHEPPPSAYLEDIERERRWRETATVTPQLKRALLVEINEGAWLPESLRRFAGL